MRHALAIHEISKWTYLIIFLSGSLNPLIYLLSCIWEALKTWL